jgi:hypothetical protein
LILDGFPERKFFRKKKQIKVAVLENTFLHLPPQSREREIRNKFFTYWFKKQGMQKTLSIILELIARKQTTTLQWRV